MVSLKYGYTQSNDTHFSSLLAPDLNCYLPPADYERPLDPNAPLPPGEPSWYRTTQGYYCGEWSAEGKVNQINLPDLRQGVTWIAAPLYPDPQNYTIGPNEPGTFRDQNRVLLEYVQDIGEYTLTARGAYNSDDFKQLFDLDHTAIRAVWGLFHFDNRREIEDYSAELRLDSPDDRPIRGSLGVYYYDQNRKNSQRSYVGPAVVFGDGVNTTAFPPSTFLDLTNTAVFGSLDFDLSDQWTLALEGRYGWDNKDLTGGALGTCDKSRPGRLHARLGTRGFQQLYAPGHPPLHSRMTT